MIWFTGQVIRSVMGLFFLVLLATACSQSPSVEESTGNLTSTVQMPASPELLELGKQTYEKKCLPCHGETGDGQGEAAYLLYPKPRNFVDARYRLVSTWDSIPTDEDLFRTISRGMPGSAMPSWAHLPEETRWGLAHYIKSFSRFPFDIGPDHQPESAEDFPTGYIEVPPSPLTPPKHRFVLTNSFSRFAPGATGIQVKATVRKNRKTRRAFPPAPAT